MKIDKLIDNIYALALDVQEALEEQSGESLCASDNELLIGIESLKKEINKDRQSVSVDFMDEMTSVVGKETIKKFYKQSKTKEYYENN